MIVQIRAQEGVSNRYKGVTKVHQVKVHDVRIIGECRCCGRIYAKSVSNPQYWSVTEESEEEKKEDEHTCEHEERPVKDYDMVGHELLEWAKNRRAKNLDVDLLHKGADACFQYAALLRSLKRMTGEES